MTDPTYTRAIFLREPKERFLSAFLDKTLGNPYFIKAKCCPKKKDSGCEEKAQTLDGFLNLTETCHNAHWNPQYDRMEPKYWPHINFIGNFNRLQDDAERLLRKVGAWEKYGANGWGSDGNLPVFARSVEPNVHSTGAKNKAAQWYTPELEKRVEESYVKDYENFGNIFKNITYSDRTKSLRR
jgi:hypothetical protein